ncbi:MAG: hypothetical protein RIT81_35705 [Deltaproteobacteria bacterium]
MFARLVLALVLLAPAAAQADLKGVGEPSRVDAIDEVLRARTRAFEGKDDAAVRALDRALATLCTFDEILKARERASGEGDETLVFALDRVLAMNVEIARGKSAGEDQAAQDKALRSMQARWSQQDALSELLAQATAFRCVFDRGTRTTWAAGAPLSEPFAGDGAVTFDGIDRERGSARLVDATGAGDVEVRVGRNAVNLIETTLWGTVNVTTIFATPSPDVEMEFTATQSGHHFDANTGTAVPTQSYGSCRPLPRTSAVPAR